jgi:hypothetical protein
MRLLSVCIGFALTVASARGAAAQDVSPDAGRRGNTPVRISMVDNEPISFVLEHASLLDLTDRQRTALMDLRRVLRRTNAPYQERLDSLRELVGLGMPPVRAGDEDRSKRERLDSLAKPVTDTIRINNDAAALRVRGLLDSAQVVRLDSIVEARRGRGSGRRGSFID